MAVQQLSARMCDRSSPSLLTHSQGQPAEMNIVNKEKI